MDEPADAVMLDRGFRIVFWKGMAAICSKWFRI